MKKLTVDIEEIACPMEMGDAEERYYLDLETGKTLIIPSELAYGELDDDECSSLPDWEKDLVPMAEEIEAGSERYASVPQVESHEGYEDIVRFAPRGSNMSRSGTYGLLSRVRAARRRMIGA